MILHLAMSLVRHIQIVICKLNCVVVCIVFSVYLFVDCPYTVQSA